jgi:hypothetical protein
MMGGPKIDWAPGRVDKRKETLTQSDVPPNGRLPDVYCASNYRLLKALNTSEISFIGKLCA